MKCEICQGTGRALRQINGSEFCAAVIEGAIPCPDCNGCGTASCCGDAHCQPESEDE
jgi:hypothetical protein